MVDTKSFRKFFLTGLIIVLGVILAINISSFSFGCKNRQNFTRLNYPVQTMDFSRIDATKAQLEADGPGLTYLKTYENQDQWRNNPHMWPVAQIPCAADYEIRRKNME